KCLAAASAESCRVVQTALISKSGSVCRAGIWAIEAKPRSGLTPTIPTLILLRFAMDASRNQMKGVVEVYARPRNTKWMSRCVLFSLHNLDHDAFGADIPLMVESGYLEDVRRTISGVPRLGETSRSRAEGSEAPGRCGETR